MDILTFLNQFYSVLKLYVQWLFTLEIISGVSLGSILFVASILWVISLFWPRQ